jgi:hypothetical protein
MPTRGLMKEMTPVMTLGHDWKLPCKLGIHAVFFISILYYRKQMTVEEMNLARVRLW